MKTITENNINNLKNYLNENLTEFEKYSIDNQEDIDEKIYQINEMIDLLTSAKKHLEKVSRYLD